MVAQVVMDIDRELPEYNKEDIALSLLRMISYNIAHIAVLNAMKFGLKRIFFGGFFIRARSNTFFWGTLAAPYLDTRPQASASSHCLGGVERAAPISVSAVFSSARSRCHLIIF